MKHPQVICQSLVRYITMRSVSMLAGQQEYLQFSLSEAGVFFACECPFIAIHLFFTNLTGDSVFSIEALDGQQQGYSFCFKYAYAIYIILSIHKRSCIICSPQNKTEAHLQRTLFVLSQHHHRSSAHSIQLCSHDKIIFFLNAHLSIEAKIRYVPLFQLYDIVLFSYLLESKSI